MPSKKDRFVGLLLWLSVVAIVDAVDDSLKNPLVLVAEDLMVVLVVSSAAGLRLLLLVPPLLSYDG